MAKGGRIDYTIGFNVNKTDLNDLKNQLNEISKMSATQIKVENPSLNMNEAMSAMQKVRAAINEIRPALDNAFDTTTGVINLEKLNNSLNKMNLSEIRNSFNAIGPKGREAFLDISKAALTTNVSLRQTSNLLDKMGETLTNTIKWGVSSSIINKFAGSVQQAYGYVQHLDTSLNDIRIVTGKSADEMDRFAEKANKAAKALGSSTTEYTEAALIYYQQGLSDEESAARAETTIKAANVTGQTGKQVSEELTAVWNGYKVTAEETEAYVDKLAAVAATSASNLEELSTGMSKVASAANAMGVDVDQLNAQLSTIISVTRQAPETAGTALKTIYARMEDLKIDGETEDGVKLGEVSSTLDEVGVHIMDVNGDIRDLGEVIEEVGNKWYTWTEAQQSAIAQAIAGKRQYNNLLALFNNWEQYNKELDVSRNATGTLQQQQDTYMESTAAHIQQLKTEWEDLYDSILDTDTINTVLDGLTKILDKITTVIDAIGGGKTLITGLLALITSKFSKQIAQAFSPLIVNMQNAQKNAKILQNLLNNINIQKTTGAIGGNAAKVMTETQQEMSKYWDLMSQEQFNASQGIIREIGEWEDKKEVIASTNLELQEYIKNSNISQTAKSTFQSEDVGLFGSRANLQATNFLETFSSQITSVQQDFLSLEKDATNLSNELDRLGTVGKEVSEEDFERIDYSLKNISKDINILQKLANKGLLGPNGQDIVDKSKKSVEQLKNKVTELKTQIGDTPDKTIALKLREDLQGVSQSLDPVNTKTKEYINNLKIGTEETKKANAEQRVLKDELDIGNLSIQKRTQAVSQLVGSMSSLVFGMQSLLNIGSILSDDDISAFEAIKQITTSLLISLPMLVSSYSQVTRALAALTLEQGIFTSQLEAENAGLMGNLVALNMHKLGLEYDTKASAKNNLITLLNVAGQKLSTTALGTNTSALWENVAAWLGLDAAAAPVLAVLTAIAAVIAAVGVAIAVGVSMYNDHIEALKRDADAQQELSKELRETTVAMEEQKEAADDLINKYDELKTSSGDFRTQLHDLLIEYGYLTEANKALTDSYEELDEMMRQIQIDANQGVIDAANIQLKQDKVTVASQLWAKGKDEDEFGFDEVSGERAIDLGDWEDTNDIQNILDKYNIKTLSSGKISLEDFSNAIVENYDELFADLSASNAESAQKLLDYITNYIDTEMISGIKETQSNKYSAQEKNIQLSTDWDSRIKDSESYNQAVNDYATQLAGENATEEEFDKAIEKAKQYFNTISDLAVQLNSFEQQVSNTGYKVSGAMGSLFEEEDIDKFEKVKNKMQEAINENYGGDADAFFSDLEQGFAVGFDNLDTEFEEGIDLITKYGEDYKAIFGEEFDWKNLFNLNPENMDEINSLTQEQLNNVYNLISQYDPTGKLSAYFTEDDWSELLGLAKDGDVTGLATSIQDKLTTAYDTALKGFQDSAGDMENNLQSIIEENFNGEVDTSEESVYSSMLADMETLKEFYPELSAEVEVFSNKALVGTEQWTQACYSLQDALSDIELERLSDEANNLFEAFKETELHFDINSEEYEKALDELLDKNYEIDVEIHADAEDSFENFSSSLDDINEMVDKIDEGFTVSAEDVRELNNTFPGILEGMEVLADGTVQLNEDIAQSAIDSAQAEEDASFETLVSQLEDQKTLLKAKQEQYQIIADAYSDLAEDETLTDKARGKVDAALNELQQLNNKSTTDYVTDNNELIATSSNDNAAITAANWTNAWQEVSNASYLAAQDAIQNQKAIDEKDKSLLQKSTFGSNYKGSNGSSSEAKQTSDLQETLDSDATNATKAAAAQALADAAGEAANDIDGMIAEATAKYKNSSFSNASAGSSNDNSSSSSEQEAETEEYLEREEDLYRAINEELDDIESTLGRIEKTQDHSWGLSYKNTLEDQNELLKDQLELLEKKKDTYEDDLSTRRKQLEDQGVTFSEDGSVMTNAETRLNELYDEYNSMVDTYNSMTASQQEAYSSTLEAQKDTIDNIEDAIDDYESAYSDYNSVLDELLDTHYELIENEVNQFNADVEIHLELAEAEDTWNDFWYDVVQDVDDTDFGGKIAKSFSKLSTLTGDNGTINELTHHLNDVVAEVDKQIAGADIGGGDSIFGDDTALSKETLINYRDQLIDAVTAAKQNIDDMVDTYLDALDDAKDKIDEQIDGWETVGDHIEHNIELIKLVSGDKAYDAIGKQYDQMYENNLALVRDAKSGMDFWQERMSYYQQQMTSAQTEAERENFEQFYEKAKENYTDAVKTLDSSLTNAIEKRKDAFLNAASEVADKMDKAFSKGMGISGVKNEWDLALEKQEHYLDNVERSLAMEELDGIFKDILDDMDARSDKQQEFLKFQDEEIAKLNEREKLTQYDIDELKARLEIKKQELALEEAKQNKSNLRLRRDSQGNYNYQYTADEDAIDDAQDGLLNARQEWYELVKKRNQETAEAVIEIRTRALEVMEERSQALADKDLARAEELTKTLEALQDEEKYYMQDAEKAKRDFFWGTAEFFEDVEQNTILPMWNTTIEQMIDEFVENGEDSFVGAIKTGISEVDKEQEKFVEDTDKLLSTAGVNYKELVSTGIDPTTEALESLNQTEEEFNDTLDETIDLFDDLESNISEATAAYNELKDAAVGAIEEANRALNTLAATAVSAISQINSAISSAESATSLAASKAGNTNSGSSSNNGDNSGGSSTTGKTYTLVTDPYGVSGTYGIQDETGNYVYINGDKEVVRKKLEELQKQNTIINQNKAFKGTNSSYKNKTIVLSGKAFDTGGYTGEWTNGSKDGRLAVLHQKELVLNEADTTNILTAVQSVRDLVKGSTVGNFSGIAESIASMAQAQVQTLAQVGSGMLQAIASMVNNSNSEVQNYRNMTVNADFSGVRSADAIYQALMELDNYGVQQAYSNAPSANKSY